MLLALALSLPLAAQAQRKRSKDINRGKNGMVKSVTVDNLPAYNNRFFRPGFYIALSNSRFLVEQSATYIQQSNLAANAINSPSGGVGFIGDIRLGPPSTPFHLRFAPGVSFLTRRVEFESLGGPNDTLNTQEVGTTQLELPLLLKYQSQRRRNTRVYFIGGVKPSRTVGTRLNDPLRNQVRLSKQDLTLEYGFGLDLFYPLFKFGPELRFSHGLRNLLTPRPDGYSQRLQSLKSNTVTLYLNIE
ncbi:porin family protein [uncultured Hymenobacter sp.]|uniref:type IX secretion/gliding motility protein PorT/SprT n=1 Tax=uncultured Hymenobacter sp. TaxID=170016 RepID=UPI0035CC1E3B